MTEANYVDAFEVGAPAGGVHSPEQWARAALEGAPQPLRLFIVFGWRVVLGFRLGPQASADHILGWRVVPPVTSAQ